MSGGAVKSVLVTGASGFVGRPVLGYLQKQNFKVHAVHRKAADYGTGVTVHQADLLQPGEADRLMAAVRPTHLLHLAWDVSTGQFWSASNNLDWVAASLHLYRAFARSGGERAVFTGTCAEYDWGSGRLDEVSTPRKPASLYGVAKNALFELITAGGDPNVSFAWARLFFLYGPGEPKGRLVPEVMTSIQRGIEVPCSPGWQERDFLHVDDAARALATVLASEHRGAVNIASGNCRPVRELVEKIGALTGRPEFIRLGAKPAPENEPKRLAANVSILNGLGFAPRYDLEDGLRDAWAWWQAQSKI
jgi:nucleoside-diphosphate-sugar epimerase